MVWGVRVSWVLWRGGSIGELSRSRVVSKMWVSRGVLGGGIGIVVMAVGR